MYDMNLYNIAHATNAPAARHVSAILDSSRSSLSDNIVIFSAVVESDLFVVFFLLFSPAASVSAAVGSKLAICADTAATADSIVVGDLTSPPPLYNATSG